MSFRPIDIDAIPQEETCPHGLPMGDYCPHCTHAGLKHKLLERRQITLTLDVECEPHLTPDELYLAVVGELTRYFDDPSGAWAPSTFYILGLHGTTESEEGNA